MATRDLVIESGFTESGDDVYGKYADGSFATVDWPDDAVSASEIANENSYRITLDETKDALFYLNVAQKAFTADAGTDVITCVAHGLQNGERFRPKAANPPAPLVQSTLYYVVNRTDDTLQLSNTSGGSVIDFTTPGSGTMVFNSPSLRTGGVDAADPDLKIGSVSKLRESELTGEAELAATLAEIQVELALVKAKTDLIGTPAGTLTPVHNSSIYVSVGSLQTVSVICNQDVSAKTLKVTAETLNSKTDIAVVADGSLTKVTTTVSFALTAPMTSVERTLRLTVRDAASPFDNYGSGLLFVTYDAQGDA